MYNIEFTSIDRVLAMVHRDIPNLDADEISLIEWAGEAVEFLKVPDVKEQVVSFIEIKNFTAEIPKGLTSILQIARNNDYVENPEWHCNPELVKEAAGTEETEDISTEKTECKGCTPNTVPDCDRKSNFDLQLSYRFWTGGTYYRNNFTPVRLTNNSFFNAIVCKEKQHQEIYTTAKDEYTIVGTSSKILKFSFGTGQVAISYLRSPLDPETGYPMIPDEVSSLQAITSYIKWKYASSKVWLGESQYKVLSDLSHRDWLKYIIQAKVFFKKAKSLDEYQNLLEQSHRLIPNKNQYYGYFGNMNTPENLNFKNNNYGRSSIYR